MEQVEVSAPIPNPKRHQARDGGKKSADTYRSFYNRATFNWVLKVIQYFVGF